MSGDYTDIERREDALEKLYGKDSPMTRDFKETVTERVKRDPEFAEALARETVPLTQYEAHFRDIVAVAVLEVILIGSGDASKKEKKCKAAYKYADEMLKARRLDGKDRG